MKKLISFILALAMAASITACSGKDENTNNESSKNETASQQSSTTESDDKQTESVSVSDDENIHDEWNAEDSSNLDISDDENVHNEWTAEDFSNLGINDIREMSMGELSYYRGSEKGITAKWTGLTDFNEITEYGEELFNNIAANHSIYKLEFGEVIGTWKFSYDQILTTFSETHYIWDRVNSFYANWFYEKDDKLIIVLYHGDDQAVTLDIYSYLPFVDEVKGDSDVLDKWNSDDFSKFGISGIEEINLGRMTYYKCSDKGLTVKWSGIDDFDAATKYGESLFKATSANGCNYELEYDEDHWHRVYNYDKKLSAFSDATDYWAVIEYCYSDWFYVLDGSKILVSYYGVTQDDGEKCLTLRILCDD